MIEQQLVEYKKERCIEVKKELKRLTQVMQLNTFYLAELFHEAQSHAYFLEWGYNNLGEFAQKELGIKERKAQYLARIIKVCRGVGLKPEHYEPAGISKLREITTLDPDGHWFNKETKNNEALDEHIVDLIAEAPDMTITEIKEAVAKLKDQTGEDRRVIRSYGITQSAWDNTVKPAMELARRNMGSAGRDEAGNAIEYSDGAIIEAICINYLQDPNNYAPDLEENGETI